VIILHLACQPAPDDRHSRLGRESRQPKKPVPSRSWLFCASPPSSRGRWTALAAARHRRRRLDTFGGRTQNTSSRGKTHSVSKKGGLPANPWTQNAPGRPKSHSVASGEDFRTATGIESTTVIPCLVPIIPYSTIRRPPLDNRHFLPLVMTLAPLESRFDAESRHNRRMLTKQFLDSAQNNSSTRNIY
jgi:hypothetical protein